VEPSGETTVSGTTWWIYPVIWHHRFWFAVTNAQGRGQWIGRTWAQKAAAQWPPPIKTVWNAMHRWQQTGRMPNASQSENGETLADPAIGHTFWLRVRRQAPVAIFLAAGVTPNNWTEYVTWPSSITIPYHHHAETGWPQLSLTQDGQGPRQGQQNWSAVVDSESAPTAGFGFTSWYFFRNFDTQAWELPLKVLIPSQSPSS
jgi:hypothetical protein